MKRIFDDDDAELDLIVPRTRKGKLVVSDVKQEAMIEVDVKGTEAAAATGELQLCPGFEKYVEPAQS